MPTTVRKDAFVESTGINMDLERKLREICDLIKERYPEQPVSIDMVLWDFRNGEKTTQYKAWIGDRGPTKSFESLEELIAYEKSLPVRNPILFRKFS